MDSLDALTYFLLNLGLHNLILVVGGLLLGLAMAYFVWGRAKRGMDELHAREHEADRRVQDAELSLAKLKEEFKVYRKEAESGAAVAAPDPVREEKLVKLAGEKEKLAEELKSSTAKRQEIEGALTSLRKDKLELENRLSAKGRAGGPSKEEFKKLRDAKKALEKELRTTTREWERKLAGKEGEGRKAAAELETLRSQVQELEGKRNKHEKDAAGKLERMAAEKKELRERVDKAEAEVREKEAKRSKAGDEEREKARKESASLRREKDKLARELKTAREEAGKAAGLRREMSALEAKLKTAENDRTTSRKELESRSSRLEQAQSSREEEVRKREGELARLRDEKKELTRQLARQSSGEDSATARVEQLLGEIGTLEERLREGENERMQVDHASAVLRQELYGLRKQLEAADQREDNTEELEKELGAAEEKLLRTQEQLVRENRRRLETEEKLRQLAGDPEEAGGDDGAAGGDDSPGNKAMAGLDPSSGEVGEPPPVLADDLTQIRGIGKVLEERLRERGVCTYRQIGRWSDGQVDEFSERLSFPGRITREDWRGQARELYAAKYGEELDLG
jgi:predicted flap endonuclease-1-like 5' DNA nuclease